MPAGDGPRAFGTFLNTSPRAFNAPSACKKNVAWEKLWKTLQREARARAFDPVFCPCPASRGAGPRSRVRALFRAIARRRPSMAANRTAVKIRLGLIETRNALKSGIVVSGCGGARTGGPVGVKPLRQYTSAFMDIVHLPLFPARSQAGMGSHIDRIPGMPCHFGYRRPVRPAAAVMLQVAVHVPDAGIAVAAFARRGSPPKVKTPGRLLVDGLFAPYAATPKRELSQTLGPPVAYGRAHQNLALTISGCLA
jgi:hypothetical protein